MESSSVQAYETSARVAAYDADMDLMHPNRHKMVEVMMAVLAASTPEPQLVVDLGTGTGFLLDRLLRRFPNCRAVAIDGSQQMVAAAKSRLGSLAERVEFVVARLPAAGNAWVWNRVRRRGGFGLRSAPSQSAREGGIDWTLPRAAEREGLVPQCRSGGVGGRIPGGPHAANESGRESWSAPRAGTLDFPMQPRRAAFMDDAATQRMRPAADGKRTIFASCASAVTGTSRCSGKTRERWSTAAFAGSR